MTSDGTRNYSYDANGNRNSTGYTTGTGNQTTNDGTWTYTYDNAGNLTKKSKGASLETWNYSYDQHNHLVTVEKHATDGGTLQLKVQYKYDALGNRIERTEDSDGNGTVDVTQRFGYDGANVWADLDGSNGLTYRRLFGPGIDSPVARITAAGTVVWYLLDYQNSVIGMVDSTGTSLGSITYDGFGNILTNTTGVNGDRYGFTSREWDSSVSLQYNRRRYYDPNLSKWTSADPMGFDAGDANLYRYVGNGPTNGVDPRGMSWISDAWDEATMVGEYVIHNPLHAAGNYYSGLGQGAYNIFVKPVVYTGEFIYDVPNAAFRPTYKPYNPYFDQYLHGQMSFGAAWFHITADAVATVLMIDGAVGVLRPGPNPNILSGHGDFYTPNGTFVVPEGTSASVHCELGETLLDETGGYLDQGLLPPENLYPTMEGAQTYLPGSDMPNLTLSPPVNPDLVIMGNPTTVTNPTLVSELVKPNMGNVLWAACQFIHK